MKYRPTSLDSALRYAQDLERSWQLNPRQAREDLAEAGIEDEEDLDSGDSDRLPASVFQFPNI